MAKSRDEVVVLLERVIAELGDGWPELRDVLVGLVAVVRVASEDILPQFHLLFAMVLSSAIDSGPPELT